MSVSKAKTGSVAGIIGGYAPLDSGLLIPNAYLDADLAAIAALTTTTIGRSLLAAADAAALRAILGAETDNVSNLIAAELYG